MIKNFKHKQDQITLDFNLRQIRYLKDVNKQGRIAFIELSRADIEAYQYLYKEALPLFKKSLKEDIKAHTGITLTTKHMEEIQ